MIKKNMFFIAFICIGLIMIIAGSFLTYKEMTTRSDLLPADAFHTNNRSNVDITDVKVQKGKSSVNSDNPDENSNDEKNVDTNVNNEKDTSLENSTTVGGESNE